MVAAFDDFVELYVTSELFPLPVIFVTYKLALASGSVSSETKVPALFCSSVTVPFAVTVFVSLTAVGASLIPTTVITISAVSVAAPSDTVYVNVSVTISPASRASVASKSATY